MRKIRNGEKIVHPQIRELNVGMKKIDLNEIVIEIPNPYTIFTKLGQVKTISTIKAMDETGIIQLPLWNQQVHTVVLGDNILLRMLML